MHDISIPVNGSRLRDRKYNFVQKAVGGCTSYDVIAQWPDLTRWIFFCQNLRKGCPKRYAKCQRNPPSRSAAILEKLIWAASAPLPLHRRGIILRKKTYNLQGLGHVTKGHRKIKVTSIPCAHIYGPICTQIPIIVVLYPMTLFSLTFNGCQLK